jgi:hypothetical protein
MGLFECEGSGELSLAAYDKYVQAANTWFHAFLTMAADGAIDRSRVLAATLDALQRDFAAFRAGWFSRLHEAMKPAKTERAALRERYLDLLNSRVPATVSFAMKALTEGHKAGWFDAAKELDRLAPAFQARDKGTVDRALALARKISRESDAATRVRAAALSALALAHESPEVQSAALELTGGDAALIAPYLDVLAPSVRAGLGTAQSVAAVSDTPTIITEDESTSRVEPLATVNELIEMFSAVLENQGPPAEIERVIDGVVRIGIAAARDDVGFERLSTPLARRAEQLLARNGVSQPRAALSGLAMAWTRRRRIPAPQSEGNLADFLIWRLWCAAEQAAQRVEQPLLSLPTSTDGRIDPGEFNRRRAALTPDQRSAAEEDCHSLFHLDFLLARLRAEGSANPVRTRLVWNKRTWEVQGKTYAYHQALLETEGSPPSSRFDPAALTAAAFRSTLEMKRWCATVSPRLCEGWFAAGCRELGSNLEWWEADWSTRAYLEPLLNAHTSIAPMGALLIALGLAAKEAGEGGLATDALIASTADSRVDANLLGRALIEAASCGAIKFARWAKRLHNAAQAGLVQARTIFHAIEILLESHPQMTGDFGRLIELEHELAHLAGLRLNSTDALRALASLNTGGKTGRAASELVKRSAT